uniref:Gasdermin B n=1 Tax=Mandrillus leucophaeus TaxID=9568 RepID=A0A2K5YKV9_MANLE
MFSIFEEITRIVVKEMDAGGDMFAVRSLIDADRVHCFHLAEEKRTVFGYGDKRLDELDSGLQGQKAEFQILDNVDSKGKLIVKLKLKRELPFSFRSINRRENLYLVTETLEMVKKETLKSDRQYKFGNEIFQSHLSYEHKGQREVTILPNRVPSYRVKQLTMNKQRLMGNRMGRPKHTSEVGGGIQPDSVSLGDKTKSFPEGKSLGSEDSRTMKEKLENVESVLQELTEDKRKDVLNFLTKCLGREELWQDLEQKISEVLIFGELQMEDPVNPLLSSLFNAAGILVGARAEAILDFLDALLELSEEQHLVAEALEKGTLPLLKDQVKPIMEQNWDELASSPHDVDCDPEARIPCALYVVVSILLELAEGPTSVSS